MTAAQELLVDRFVACPAIRRAHCGINDEAIVVGAGLTCRNLMAVEAGNALFGMFTQLVLVNDGILKIPMALGTLAARTHESLGWLLNLDFGPARIHQKRG